MDPHPTIAAILGGSSGPEEKPPDDLTACCHDLMVAMHGKDSAACAEAFRACFACCEAEPHEEAGEAEKE